MVLLGRPQSSIDEQATVVHTIRKTLAQCLQQDTTEISDAQVIAAVLHDEPSVDECAVLHRQTSASESEWVAYVATFRPISAEKLTAHVSSFLPDAWVPSHYVPISTLPLTASGALDVDALATMAVLDEDLVEHWESALKRVLKTEQVAVLAQASTLDQPVLHLSDLLPDWETVSTSDDFTPHDDTEALAQMEGDRPSHTPALGYGGDLPVEPEAPTTLAEVLQQAAQTVTGDRITYLSPDGTEIQQSYRDLLDEAERMLTGLRSLGLKPQDKVLFQLELTQDIIPAFWGCILGGFIPVIMSPPPSYSETNSGIEKLCNVWSLLDQPLIVTSAALTAPAQNLSQWLPTEALRISSIDDLRQNDPTTEHHTSQSHEIAFFNLTSGSTGMPKCIGLTHHNLIARARGTNILCQHSPDDIILNWLPFDHIGSISDWHVRCILLGCHLVYTVKEYVLGRPLNWIDLIHRYRITHSWAPNFAYALVNDGLKQEPPQQPWDLSCVESLLTAGEAVSSKAVEEFIENLAPYGFETTAIRPAFGMAEMGSGITYYQPTQEQPILRHTVDKASLKGAIRRVSPDHPNCSVFTDLGPVIPGVSIRIVDAQNAVLMEDTIGRLQVKGAAVSPGYYKNPDVNREVFLEDGWFDTGDLGFLCNGHLVVTGRAKETIIINGANYYNHEIEAVVDEIEGIEVSYTAACAVSEAGSTTEKLAIFFNTPIQDKQGQVELIRAVRQAVVAKIGLNPDYLIPVEQAAIPKTAIGKIQRSQLSKRFQAGEFAPVLKQVDILLGNTNTLPNWFYRTTWRPKQACSFSLENPTGQTLVFLDASGLGEAICQTLRATGRACISVEMGADFEEVEGDRFRLNPGQPNHYQQLFEHLSQDGQSIGQVIHLWSYGPYTGELTTASDLETALVRGTYSVLYLIQALAHVQGDAHPVQLLVGSSYAQATSNDTPVAAEKSPVLGLLKAAPQELTWLDCRHVDLDEAPVQNHAHQILLELQVAQPEREVAYRQGQRLIQRLRAVDWRESPRRSLPFKPGGCYLLSGGLGGIGLEIATFLLQQFDARLILVGRTPLPERSQWDTVLDPSQDIVAQRVAAYKTLEQLSGDVRYAAVDICNLDALRQAVAEITADWQTELDGIIHLAGNAPERLIMEETNNSLAATLSPKVLGTWNLHQLMKQRHDGLFISFSSLASVFGGAMIGAYAAANSFLDRFCHIQQQANLQSYCFAWAMWDGVGLSRESQAKDLLRAKGYRAVSAQQGLSSFLAGLYRSPQTLLVGLDGSKRNIRQFVETSQVQEQALYGYFVPDTAPVPESLSDLTVSDRFGTSSTCILRQLTEMPLTEEGTIDRETLANTSRTSSTEPVQARSDLDAQLIALWKEILDVPQVGIRDNFFELGGSSLQAARLFTAIEQTFGRNLPLSTLFTAPTIEQLADLMGQDGEAVSWSPLVAIQPQGSKAPLFCIHGAGGNVLMYRELLPHLDPDQPIYGLQAVGLDGMEAPLSKLEEIAAIYLQEIRTVQPEGPYFLLGLSAGGVIAFEMAQILRQQGQEVALLGLIDSHGPGYPQFLPLVPRLVALMPHLALYVMRTAIARLKGRVQPQATASSKANSEPSAPEAIAPSQNASDSQTESATPESAPSVPEPEEETHTRPGRRPQRQSLRDRLEYFSIWILQFTPWSFVVPRFYLSSGHDIPDTLQRVKEANVRAMLAYEPSPYPDTAVMFRATSQPPGCYTDPYLGWGDVIKGGIKIYDVPGSHGESLLYRAESSSVLGPQLKEHLETLERDQS